MSDQDTLSYDASLFQELLRKLLEESGESYRKASRAAGLHHTAISKYMSGVRPGRDACIALADHFGINPNKLLEAAGYEPLHFFDRREIDLTKVSPEGKEILEKLEQITDPKIRKRLFEVIDVMLDGYLLAEQEGAVRIEVEPRLAPASEPTGGT